MPVLEIAIPEYKGPRRIDTRYVPQSLATLLIQGLVRYYEAQSFEKRQPLTVASAEHGFNYYDVVHPRSGVLYVPRYSFESTLSDLYDDSEIRSSNPDFERIADFVRARHEGRYNVPNGAISWISFSGLSAVSEERLLIRGQQGWRRVVGHNTPAFVWTVEPLRGIES